MKRIVTQHISKMVDEEQIKSFVSTVVLKGITDKGLEAAIRRILFNPDNKIDWDHAYDQIIEQMPELADMI